MNRCDLLGAGLQTAGNANSSSTITVRRWAAIGDSLAATVVADKLLEQGLNVRWVTHPAIQPVIQRHPRIATVTESGVPDVDLDGAYESDPLRRQRHFSEMFLERANQQLRRIGINLGPAVNCRPRIYPTRQQRELAEERFAPFPKPWVFINPRSESYVCRQVPDVIWAEAAKKINGTKFWLGVHPAPAGIVDLRCRQIADVITWLSAADLLISVDTGPLHIGAALGVPVLALGQSSSPDLHLSDQCDFLTIDPKLGCLNCQKNLCPIDANDPPCQKFDPSWIASWANAKLLQHTGGLVSAVVPIWRPDVRVLNRCLEAVLPQVYEVVVSSEGRSIMPPGAMRHPKIRYVHTPRQNIGFSGNMNFGARCSVGQYLLLLNDDCFLNPGAVQGMLKAFRPDTAIVTNLLRYPDGLIYHAGKVRTPGVKAWHHIDYRHRHPTFEQVTELENACGCCMLVRRSAFYQVDAFDEEMAVFGSDDDLCLKVRQCGWKVLFTPFSEGVHMEHQSVNKLGNVTELVRTANAALARKWDWYLEYNRDRVPGLFA